MQVFNARTQQLEDVTWHADKNRELVATFQDGGIVKFPAGTTEANLEALVEQHLSANQGQEVITPEQEAAEAEERRASEDLAHKLNGNTMPESDTTNASTEPTSN